MTVKVCASVTAKTLQELRIMVKKAEQAGADLIEIRMDYLKEDYDVREIRNLTTLPMIATNRPPEEGGLFAGAEDERIDSLLEAASNGFDFIDVELMTKNVEGIAKRIKGKSVRLITSFHRFPATPSLSEINKVFQRELAVGADVCKIITTAEKVEDNLTCLQFVNKASRVKDVICFCMGRSGTPSRLLSPIFGGFLTYASVERGREAALGQLTVAETRRFYELMGI